MTKHKTMQFFAEGCCFFLVLISNVCPGIITLKCLNVDPVFLVRQDVNQIRYIHNQRNFVSPKTRHGVEFFMGGYYFTYKNREKISDPLELPNPSKEQIDSWKKKNLVMPFPPKYIKPKQTTDDYVVWKTLQSYYSRLQECSNIVEFAYVEYVRYGLDVTPINVVCGKIVRATQVRAWKDAWERTTRVRKGANEMICDVVNTVRASVDDLFIPLVSIKQKEYAAWARTHPQEAMVIMVRKRIAATERRVEIAEQEAQKAKSRAVLAEEAAQAAAGRAAEAERNAADAARNAADAARNAAEAEARERYRRFSGW